MWVSFKSVTVVSFCLATAALVAGPAAAQAGVIDSALVNGMGLEGPVVTETANNDNYDFWSNNGGSFLFSFHSLAPVDTVFSVTDSGGSTEYDLYGRVTNRTGASVLGVRLELGFGTSTFSRATLPGLSFDLPEADPGPVMDNFAPVLHTDTLIQWTHLIPNTDTPSFEFFFDLPDADAGYIPASALTTDGYDLTLRITPLVPEPMSWLCGLGLAASLAGRRPHGRSCG